MAACELKGELKYRDGRTSQFTVQADGNLKSVITGIKKLNADISEVLTALVEQERDEVLQTQEKSPSGYFPELLTSTVVSLLYSDTPPSYPLNT
uniref:Si:dkeyp-55f12.3 n=1 Tax=Sinocyclocheilus grahami TaxID=75366 RepID=A0A672P9W2_SINGR